MEHPSRKESEDSAALDRSYDSHQDHTLNKLDEQERKEREQKLDWQRWQDEQQQNDQQEIKNLQLFIGGISPMVSENELSQRLSKYGKLIECRLMIDKDT